MTEIIVVFVKANMAELVTANLTTVPVTGSVLILVHEVPSVLVYREL